MKYFIYTGLICLTILTGGCAKKSAEDPVDTGPDGDTDRNSDTDADGDTDADSSPEGDTDADSSPEGDTDADSSQEGDTDADTDVDSDADTYTEMDTDTNTGMESDTQGFVPNCVETRSDGACKLDISESGSLQNPAFSPDSASIALTRWRSGYNEYPADLFVFDLKTGTSRLLVSDGSANVNLPGSAWNAVNHKITFCSDRGRHDEIYTIDGDGSPGDATRVTDRSGAMAWEPSFSPDGLWVTFESHDFSHENIGEIFKYKLDGTEEYQALTPDSQDCRQPNWSPAGDLILYQRRQSGAWDIWVMATDGSQETNVTGGIGDSTDASFSPDGQRIVFSGDQAELAYSNIYVIPVKGGAPERVTHNDTGYDGAPSWSPDGRWIAFESCTGEPDGTSGTEIWIIEADRR